MKLPCSSLIKSLALVMVTMPMLASDCSGDGNSNVGYHYIEIPNFEVSDYLKMLDSKTDEFQYNAICHFTETDDYPKTLETDSLKGTGKYDTALLIYNAIYPKISSSNDWVSSAAIRFVNNFRYNRAAFINEITVLNKPSRNVQLEIINSLENDTLANKESLFSKYKFLRSQPSWLLQTSAFSIGAILSEEHINALISAYKKSNEQYEKSLIIYTFSQNVTDQVFDFLTSEWATTKNEVLKSELFETLIYAKKQETALHWFNKHDSALNGGLLTIMEKLDYFKKNDIHINLLLLAIEKGLNVTKWKTEDDSYNLTLVPLIFDKQLKYRYGENFQETNDTILLNNCLKIESALFKNPTVKKEWEDMVKIIWKYELPRTLIDRQNSLTKEYLQKTRELFDVYGIDTSEYKPFIKEIISSSNNLVNTKIKKKD